METIKLLTGDSWEARFREIMNWAPAEFEKMTRTEQDPLWHGEGDVLTHTRMVCRALTDMEEFQKLDEVRQCVLYLAAAFHDIGKPATTQLEDGRLRAPSHARVGAEMARYIFWTGLDFCGSQEKQRIRESVCTLIRYHGLPLHALEDADGKLRLMQVAAHGELTGYATVKLLCMLSKADILGRIADDTQELLEKVALCEELAKEAGCFEGAYSFPDAHTARSFLKGRNVSPAYPLYDDTWGEVILMSGLPGTGKDTWIRANHPEMPMISLDEIRKELGISPVENQSKVLDTAKERAKELLRRKESFIWNATNFTAQTRQKLIELFEDYGAAVRVVYLETPWQEQLRRNRSRTAVVPERAVCRMLEKLTPPEQSEANYVNWICV